MPLLNLRKQGAAAGITLGDGPALSESDRLDAIATWKGRMVNEHISARVFAGLIPQLLAAEICPDRQAAVADMVAEELRHGRMCAGAVHALGGDACAELPPLPPVPDHEDCGPLESLLRNVISICCMNETIAVGLISAERMQTKPEALKEALKHILADEVGHARFGWTLLDEVADRIDDDMRHRLDDYLVAAFGHMAEHQLSHIPPRPSPSEAANEVGVCDGNEARRLFFDTVEQSIIPGLEQRGFRAREAWASSQAALPQ
jgi:hypothetical protein